MYFVIGIDGKEYGPFSSERLRQWIDEGRANRYSRVRQDGETAWQALGDLPEFADASPRADQPAPPPPPLRTAEAIAADYLTRSATIDIGSAFTRGWKLLRGNLRLLVGASVLVWMMVIGLSLVPKIGWAAGLVANSALFGGLYYFFLRRIRGEYPTIRDVFAGFGPAFVNLVLAGAMQGLLTTLGLLAFIVPGVYLAVCYLFVLPLVIDKRMDFWTAMEVSRRVVHRQWWTAFGFALVALLVVGAGILTFVVGAVVAIPLSIAALMYVYEDLFDRP